MTRDSEKYIEKVLKVCEYDRGIPSMANRIKKRSLLNAYKNSFKSKKEMNYEIEVYKNLIHRLINNTYTKSEEKYAYNLGFVNGMKSGDGE